MLTAKDGEYDEADALDLGADDFLAKPFSYVVLVAHLRALLRRAPSDRSPHLQVGDLRLEPATRRCFRGGQEVRLTAREFALAELLARRADQVVTRAEILEQVWNADVGMDSNVVEVYVGYLRRKLDEPFGLRTLETIRGAGYRLVVGDSTGAETGPDAGS
jgi:DNA-binding response OmpR family regulator